MKTLIQKLTQICGIEIRYSLWKVNVHDGEDNSITLNIPTLLGILIPLQLIWGRPIKIGYSLAHELGHAFFDKFDVADMSRAHDLFGDFNQEGFGTKGFVMSVLLPKEEGFITKYARLHPDEDFADCFALLVLSDNKIPEEIKDRKILSKLRFIRKLIRESLR